MATLSTSALIDADALCEIIETDLTDARLHNFINMAVALTSQISSAVTSCGGDLEQIQLLLAAHFLTMYERTTKSESIGGEWTVSYAMQDGPGLQSSLYGQNAIALDCSGMLARQGLKRASIHVTSYYQTRESERLFDEDLL